MSGQVLRPAVAIVGAGPAGLTAAADLAGEVDGQVLVLEREDTAGGIPRHSDHQGYGVRDLHRTMSGPVYARRLTASALSAGATIMTGAMVTSLTANRELTVTTRDGLLTVLPDALILATGARERPRAARLIPGDRPAGVLTTGQLQNEVHLRHRKVGSRAVIVGSELVSWSAILTLRHAGCRTVLMTSVQDRPEIYTGIGTLGSKALRVPLALNSRVVGIHGHQRVEAITLEDTRTGETRRVECDTVVLTGDWIPDHELARMAGLDMADTHGPAVDGGLRTSGEGIFAAGNVLHPVDTADIAALDGRHVVTSVQAWLRDKAVPGEGVNITTIEPLRWMAPSRISVDGPNPPRARLIGWVDQYIARPTVVVTQGDTVVARRRLRWPAAPGRAFRVPTSVLDGVDRRGQDVVLSIE